MKQYFFERLSMTMSILLPLLLLTNCTDETLSDEPLPEPNVKSLITTTTVDCSTCTYVVPAKTHVIDGNILKLQPGSVIGLDASTQYYNLVFRNIVGTADNPIIIKNCNGTAVLNGTGLSF